MWINMPVLEVNCDFLSRHGAVGHVILVNTGIGRQPFLIPGGCGLFNLGGFGGRFQARQASGRLPR